VTANGSLPEVPSLGAETGTAAEAPERVAPREVRLRPAPAEAAARRDRTRVARREPLGTTIRSLPLGESGSGFGRTPSVGPRFLDGPIAVSAPTKIGETGATGEDGTPGDGAPSIDDETDDETDDSEFGAGEPDRATPTYENAPIRATAEDVPGFGPLQSLAALAVTLLVAIRTRRTR